jgi:hypothetical protein
MTALTNTKAVALAAILASIVIAPAQTRTAWDQPGWETRLEDGIAAGVACGKTVNIDAAQRYLFGAADDLGQIPAYVKIMQATVAAMKKLHEGRTPNCSDLMAHYGEYGDIEMGLLSDGP